MVGKLLLYKSKHMLLVTRHQHYHLLLSPARRGLTQRRDLRDAADKDADVQNTSHLVQSVAQRNMPLFIYCKVVFLNNFVVLIYR